MVWNDVEFGFQVAFQAAWEAYIGGSIPIGAAILNQNDKVVSVGRNRIFEKVAPQSQISNHQLAHAEINAILQLSEDDNPAIRSYMLYAVMEPCPFCLGAIAMGSIKHVKFAARDGWAGATSLVSENKYLHNKNIQIEGPFTKLEQIQITWQASFELDKHGDGMLLNNWNNYCPDGVKAARRLHHSKRLHELLVKNASVEEAFEFTASTLSKL